MTIFLAMHISDDHRCTVAFCDEDFLLCWAVSKIDYIGINGQKFQRPR